MTSTRPVDSEPSAVPPDGVAGDGLASNAARGAAVTLGGQAARVLLQFGSVVVLARLLTPHDYGLLAVVLVVVGIGEIFRDFGLTTASVQARDMTDRQRSALFWLNTVLGVTMAAIAFALSGLIADLFGQQQLTAMIQFLSLTFVLNGMATQYRADLNRRMRFGSLVVVDVVAQACGLTVGIVCAVSGAGYWSLVALQLSQVATALALLVVSGRWTPGRPRRCPEVRPIVRMGLHFGATQLLYYATNNVDTVTIGLRFSTASLGIYNRGFQLVTTPLNQIRGPATTVALPVLSRLRDDVVRAGEYIRRSQLALGYTIVAGLAIGVGGADRFVALLLGPTWAQVSPVLALLAAAGCLSTLSFVGLWVYLSRGLARDLMRYTAVSLVLQVACVVGGSTWGIVGVAWGYAVAAALEWPLSLYWLSRRTELPIAALMQGALRILGCAVVAGVAVFATTRAVPGPAAVGAAVAVVTGVASYGLLALLVRPVRDDLVGVVDFARRVRSS